MWWLAAWGCGGEGDPPVGTPSEAVYDEVYVYENTGVACLRSPSELLVDFEDCLFCSQNQFICEAELDGDRVEVRAGGQAVVSASCSEGSTCESTLVRCTAPELPDGSYTLVYAGVEVALEVPTSDWVCTGPTEVL